MGERRAVALGAAGLLCGPVWAGLRGVHVPALAAWIISAAALGAAAWLLAPRLPATLDGVARRRPLLVAFIALFWCAGAANLIRISPFMVDPTRTSGVLRPGDRFYEHHNCFSAYVRASELARDRVPNLYEQIHYFGDRENDPRDHIGPLNVDLYEYPPPFLLPVRLALAASSDFFALRAVWFMLESALVAWALIALAMWIGGRDGLAVGVLAPTVFASMTSVGTLAVGNFQIAAYALAVLAMIAFDRERDVLGGALLAFAAVSKLFPGLLVIVLLARRRWRAAGLTAAWGIAFGAIALGLFGAAPFRAFLGYQLPRMADGTAFPFLERFPPATALNHSIFGIVIKLKVLAHVPGMTTRLAGWVAWVYTAAIGAFAFLRARRPQTDRLGEALFWLVLLQLAALRSPFTPNLYALFMPVWIMTLLAVRAARGTRILFAVLWLGFGATILFFTADNRISFGKLEIVSTLDQLAAFAVVAIAMRRPMARVVQAERAAAA
jgi:hypothetical protein